jgi:response regulator of citrate/malate metabolism
MIQLQISFDVDHVATRVVATDPSFFVQVQAKRDAVDICENNHKGNEESKEAHGSINGKKAAMYEQILGTLYCSYGRGLTCDEVEERIAMSHQTCSARFSELKRDGLIVSTGERRKTRSGRPAMAYRINEDKVQKRGSYEV